jgi:D-glycero-beta-D-manno-heptose 1-phosphate adenylyltransferase
MSEIIIDRTELKNRVDALKAQGKKVVFANGCFNLLHVGHLRFLEDAKSFGDILVVAVNTSESVIKLKGKDYPVLPTEERTEMIAGFRCVDIVTTFGEPNCTALLTLLEPNIQAKGPDYTVETVPERETVLAYGGEVAIAGDPKDHSSTNIMRDLAYWGERESAAVTDEEAETSS